MSLRIAKTLLTTGVRACSSSSLVRSSVVRSSSCSVRSFGSCRSLFAASAAKETLPELTAPKIPESITTYLDRLERGQTISYYVNREFHTASYNLDVSAQLAVIEDVDRRCATANDATKQRLQYAALWMAARAEAAATRRAKEANANAEAATPADDKQSAEQPTTVDPEVQREQEEYDAKYGWANKLIELSHPTLADVEATHRYIVQKVRDFDASLVAQYPDMYVRAAHVASYRAELYSEYNSVIERIERKHGVVFPTIIGAPRKPGDLICDPDSPDYDEAAIAETAIWADYRPEELISCTAIQNEHTGLWEGKFRGEDVVFPEAAPTLEWVCTTPVDAHLFEEAPCVKVPEDEVIE